MISAIAFMGEILRAKKPSKFKKKFKKVNSEPVFAKLQTSMSSKKNPLFHNLRSINITHLFFFPPNISIVQNSLNRQRVFATI